MPPRLTVRFDPAFGELHGRLLVFLTRAQVRGYVEPAAMHPSEVEILGTEVDGAPAGSSIELSPDGDAYPSSLRTLAPGDYTARAELDVQHRYAYDGGQPGDPTSGNVFVTIEPGGNVTLDARERRAPQSRRAAPPAPPGARWERFVSPSLSAFFARPIAMQAYVVPPPDYANGTKRYPTVYVVGAYGASRENIAQTAAERAQILARNGGTSLIYVYLDPHVPLGHSVFADSVNNGPWGQALTTELIPSLESRWRMTGSEATRFLTGHSSGGWATMWLQTTYPEIFGGTWSTSPDPLDFHAFSGPDLVTDPSGNMYRDRFGRPYRFMRVNGQDVALLSDYILQERALGPRGGQFASFEAVFSPRGADGRPQPLFDRGSGRIDPAVARAWEERYDIVRNLRRNWPQIGASLRGKIHVWVGTWDTFHLEESVHRLQATLAQLPRSDAQITFVANRDHLDLYGGPHGGLTVEIDRQMTAAAARSSAGPERRPELLHPAWERTPHVVDFAPREVTRQDGENGARDRRRVDRAVVSAERFDDVVEQLGLLPLRDRCPARIPLLPVDPADERRQLGRELRALVE